MKRAGFLYDRIAGQDNLNLAFVKAVRGKSSRREVVEFRANFTENMQKIRQQFQEESVTFGNYHSFYVRDPKRRLIHAASFTERIMHHAIMNVCEPVLEQYAIYDSYACRPGKGLQRAIQRCRRFASEYGWYLKLDIHKYFDSIHHQTVHELLTRRIKDIRILDLFAALLATYCTTPGRGLPIGNLISQHLANFYLGCMDHWLKEERKIRGYLRYMDDFILFADSREWLNELATVISFLDKRLSLQLKDDIQLNRCVRGIQFLGFRVFPHQVRLGRRSKRRFVEKFMRYEYMFRQGYWDEQQLSDHVRSLTEFTKNGDTKRFRDNVLSRHGGSF